MKVFKLTFSAALIIAASALLLSERLLAVTIPLDNAVINSSSQNQENNSKGSSSGGIAYVDIEFIFNQHPMTARLKTEFEAEVDKRKKEFMLIESSMTSIQDVIVSSTAEISKLKAEIDQVKKAIEEKNQPPKTMVLPGTTNVILVTPAVSSTTLKADPSIIDADEKIIKEREATIASLKEIYSKDKHEIDVKTKTNKSDLVKLEADNTQEVLSDIYKILGKIATEEGITIVVDKNNVLYGQASQDLTQKVLERMRGH